MHQLSFLDYAAQGEHFYTADLTLPQGETVTPHTHDFYEFFVVLQGAFREFWNGGEHTVTKMQVHVLRPQDCHGLSLLPSKEASILRNIAVSTSSFERILDGCALEDTSRLFRAFTLDEPAFASYLSKTNLLYHVPRNSQAQVYLFESILQDMVINGLFRKNNDSDIPFWLRRAYEEMERGNACVEGLPLLIRLSGRSQEHLTREFQRYYQITPTDFINQLRLKRAAQRLRLTTEKIIHIVYDSGFHNLSYFNRLFRRQYGITPLEYRRRNQAFFEAGEAEN